MTRSFRACAAAAMVILAAACAGTAYEQARPVNERSSRNRLECDEIRSAMGAANAYDLVRMLRPAWLQTRGTVSILAEPGIGLVVDGRGVEGLDRLGDIPSRGVLRLELLQPDEAQIHGHYPQGAIRVTTGTCEAAAP